MSAIVPKDILILWVGNHSAIPLGFSREVALDGRYPKGTANATDPNTTGGNATHQHSATANHSHTMNNHTHTYTLQGGSTGQSNGKVGSGNGIVWTHTHTGTSGASSGGDLSSVSATYDAVSNDPPYYEVIYIKSDGSKGVPNNAVMFSDSGTLPSGYGAFSSLQNKYPKGAGTGANAGSTGGSTTNIHTLSHTHTVASHTHANSTSSVSPSSSTTTRTSTNDGTNKNHTHVVTFTATTSTIDNTAPSITTSETVEPSYKKLLAVQNTSGDYASPLGLMGLWLGSLATIPVGWVLCDGNNSTQDMRGYYIKGASSSGEIGNTGGSNTHTHSSNTHTHTGIAHTHTGSHDTHAVNVDVGDPGSSTRNTTIHPVVVDNATASYANGTTSANSANNEPLYTTVAVIKCISETFGGGTTGAPLLLKML